MADQAISLNHQRVLFSNTKTIETVKIKNNLNEHIIIKVKCTSNSLFTIRPPVFGINEHDETSVNLICKDVSQLEKDKDGHHFVVYYLKVKKEDKKTARQILDARKRARQGQHDGKKKLPVEIGGDEKEKKSDSGTGGKKTEEAGGGKKVEEMKKSNDPGKKADEKKTEDAPKKPTETGKKTEEKKEKTAEDGTKKEGKISNEGGKRTTDEKKTEDGGTKKSNGKKSDGKKTAEEKKTTEDGKKDDKK